MLVSTSACVRQPPSSAPLLLRIHASGSLRTSRLIVLPSTKTQPNLPSYAVAVGVVLVVGVVVAEVVVVGVVVVSVVLVVGVDVADVVVVGVLVLLVVCVVLVVGLVVSVVLVVGVVDVVSDVVCVDVSDVVVVSVDVGVDVTVVCAHDMVPTMNASSTSFNVSATDGPAPAGCPVDRMSPAQLTTASLPAGPRCSVSKVDSATAASSHAVSLGALVTGSRLTTTPCFPTRLAQPRVAGPVEISASISPTHR